MTIKDFAKLCDCNPQTLRYYDRVELLKPIRVDPWTGYRFYEEAQALAFVTIKNLQKAGFSIEEIKPLLGEDRAVIYRAFEAKIAEGERRLREIREIQQSYQSEMNEIQRKIREVKERVMEAMERHDLREEFGIDAGQYADIVGSVEECFREVMLNPPEEFEYEEYQESCDQAAEEAYLKLLENPDWELVYESHGWHRAKELLAELGELENGGEYAVHLRMEKEPESDHTAFCNVLLGVLLMGNKGKKLSLSCNVENTQDGQRHFWLFKRKA